MAPGLNEEAIGSTFCDSILYIHTKYKSLSILNAHGSVTHFQLLDLLTCIRSPLALMHLHSLVQVKTQRIIEFNTPVHALWYLGIEVEGRVWGYKKQSTLWILPKVKCHYF